MEFDEALKNITDELLKIGSDISQHEYDGLIVKELASSNTLDEGRSTKQTHVAISGPQIDMFPYLCADNYLGTDYDKKDDVLKAFYVAEIPAFIHKENISYFDPDQSLTDAEECKVYVSVIRSKREKSSDQIQISMKNLDSKEFIKFRKLVPVGSYMIVLKRKQELIYDFFYVKNSDATDSLKSMNNGFYKLKTRTPVEIDKYFIKEGTHKDYDLNRIVFGAPGTGKSYQIEQDRKDILRGSIGGYERVTFYPDYTYSKFVGTYKPVSDGKEISYKFVPGPFMRVLVQALESCKTDHPEPFVLIIEEINRAPVAAVFGDVFQLLDRNDDGVSEYAIESSEDIKNYLSEKLGGEPDDYSELRIPNNMFIWATMNSADQGVFPMDTAFKRRWSFEYLGVNENDSEIKGRYVTVAGKRFEWNSLRKEINDWMARKGINEDKQLGPYFLSKKIIVSDDGSDIDADAFIKALKNKVLMYLFDDAVRQRRSELFSGASSKGYNINRYSSICEAFDKWGIDIFDSSIVSETEKMSSKQTGESKA